MGGIFRIRLLGGSDMEKHSLYKMRTQLVAEAMWRSHQGHHLATYMPFLKWAKTLGTIHFNPERTGIAGLHS